MCCCFGDGYWGVVGKLPSGTSVLISCLLGANIDQRTAAGRATSLHRAAHMGHTEIANIL